jgi:hypothetical protein
MQNAPTATTPSTPVSNRTARIAAQRVSRRRWIDIALAATVIIGMLASTFWYANVRIGGNGPRDPDATRYAAQPLSSTPNSKPEQADASSEDDARGGSFGTAERSLVYPDLKMSPEPLSLAWSQVVRDPMWSLPYGDVVASLGSSEITVQDASSGEVLWSKSTSDAFRNETHDTERDPKLLLGQRQGQAVALPWIVGDTMYYAGTSDLIGVDVHTGEELFRTIHTIPDENTDLTRLFFPWDMSVKDGVAYVLTIPTPGLYILKALDLDSGETLWSYEAGDPVEDWMDASTFLSQLVVTDSVVAMQVSNGENSILVLDASDGSVLWQQPNALLGGGESIASSNISAMDDQYLLLMHRGNPTGATDGTPNADQSLGVALYNLEDGYLLWSTREGTGGWSYPDQGTGACSLVPGWTSTDLYIPCSTDDTVYLFSLPLSGNPSLVGTWETSARAYPNFYDDQAAYLNTGTELLRIDYYSHEMTVIPITGGQACMGSYPPENNLFLCTRDDGLWTYTLQAYAQAPSIATPQASPAVSNVQRDAEAALLTNDPGNTSAYPAGYDPALTEPAEKLEVTRVAPESAVISGNTLVISGQVLKNASGEGVLTYGTQAIDLTRGEELWFVDTGLTGDLVVDEWNVYGYQIDPINAFSSSKLVSLSLDSGNMNWMIQTLTSTPNGNVAPNHHRLIMIGSYLYVPFTNGSVIAYDQSGNTVWAHETGESLPNFWEYDRSPVTGDEDAIYIAGSSGEITKLDRLTGETIDTFTVAAAVPKATEVGSSMDLHLRGDSLVTVVHPPAPLEPDNTETIVALSAHSGDPNWVQEVTYQTGNLVLTETVVGVPQYVFDEGPTEQKITFYNLATGEVLYEAEVIATANPVLSASGEVICLYTSRVECGTFDGLQRVVTGVGFSNSLSNNPPIMYWNGQLVILDIMTGVYITQSTP